MGYVSAMGRSLLAVTVAALVLSACGSDGEQAPDAGSGGAVRPAEERADQEEARLEASGLTMQVPDGLLDACSKAAEDTELEVVYCPPVAPDGESVIEYASGDPSFPGDPPSYSISMRSDGVDDPGSGGHWAIEAAAATVELEDKIIAGIRRSRETPDRERVRLSGVPATVLRVQSAANDFHKGHVVVLWRFDDVDYVISLHGHDNEPQAKSMARALIQQMSTCANVGEGRAGPERCQFVIEAGGAEEAR